MVLVPALMQLFGRANWWMPRWLDDRLPRVDPETVARRHAVKGSGTPSQRCLSR
jgi:putative drug exporter of the RND superfamily